MNILLVTREFPPYFGGVGTYAFELSQAAAALGHRVEVVAPRAEAGDRPDNVEVHLFRPGGTPARDILPIASTIRKCFRRQSFDLVHACERASLIAAKGALRRRGSPICVTVHGSETHRWRTSSLFKWVDPRLYRSAQAIAANSEYTLAQLRIMLELGSRRRDPPCKAVPLAVSDWWLEHGIDRRAANGVNERFVLGTLGRLDPRKGHMEVLQVCGNLSEPLRRRLLYLVVGPGPEQYVARLALEAARLGVAFEYAGAPDRAELPALVRRMDVHVLFAKPVSHTIEGFGLVVVEVATQAVPTVATRLGGIPEVLVHEETGILVEPGNSVALAKAIQRVMEKPDLVTTLGQQAHKRVMERRWSDVAKETYDFFEMCCGSRDVGDATSA